MKPARPNRPPPTDWGHVADWYDGLVGDEGSEFHQRVIFPGVLRLLAPAPGAGVLDFACGQGAWCRVLHERGCKVTGIDPAEGLIRQARQRGPVEISYLLGDAGRLVELAPGPFDAATCILALQNIPQPAPVLDALARVLRPGGRVVLVLMHPCFRSPKATRWGWDVAGGVQYRRIDRYLLPRKEPIITHPGRKTGQYTWTFHRPLGAYVRAVAGAGLLVDALEEWPSHRHSDSGPRAAAENQARREIPMFLALRAVKSAGTLAP
jgi:ubiquinone/menaquinone biosynthesis C-methylase UbiE